MEFLNIGGGELIVIVLLAIILFGPEDILKIMQTIGGYVRKIQQMSAGVLKGDYIPEEIKETIKETQASVAELQKTVADVKAIAEADLSETITAAEDVKTTLEDMSTSVAAGMSEVPKALDATLHEPAPGAIAATATKHITAPPATSESEQLEKTPSSAAATATEDDSTSASTDPGEEDE